MFTGIVQGLCSVSAITEHTNISRLRIDLGPLAHGIETGASVAINGTCLTVTAAADGLVDFDVIQETLNTTNLGDLRPSMQVNVERSFRVGDEIGGHILSGHVTARALVVKVEEQESRRDITFEVDPQWMRYLHHKGFVAIDGASLTLSSVDYSTNRLSISLIPETISRTTLGTIAVGDRVNLEVDSQTQAVVNTVERMLQTPELLEGLGLSR